MSIKQSAKHAAQDTPGDRIPKCWEAGAEHSCLRIETVFGETFLLPYQQFISAYHRRCDDGETVELAFLSHDVRLAGHELGTLVDALQDFSVARIAPLPTRYRNIVPKAEPAIHEIEIKPVEKGLCSPLHETQADRAHALRSIR